MPSQTSRSHTSQAQALDGAETLILELPAMPLGDRTQMLIEILDSLKDDQICLSCSFEYIRAYVSEQLGCQHKILQVHFVRSTRVFIIIIIYIYMCSPKTFFGSRWHSGFLINFEIRALRFRVIWPDSSLVLTPRSSF